MQSVFLLHFIDFSVFRNPFLLLFYALDRPNNAFGSSGFGTHLGCYVLCGKMPSTSQFQAEVHEESGLGLVITLENMVRVG